MLGLTTQVPAKAIYLSDGPSERVRIGNREIIFKNARPKDLGSGDLLTATVIQALRYLGKDAVTEHTVATLRRALSPAARRKLVRDAKYASYWIFALAQQIAAPGETI